MYCLGTMGPEVSDYNKWLIILSMIQLSGGHCTTNIPEAKNRRFVRNNIEKSGSNVKSFKKIITFSQFQNGGYADKIPG